MFNLRVQKVVLVKMLARHFEAVRYTGIFSSGKYELAAELLKNRPSTPEYGFTWALSLQQLAM